MTIKPLCKVAALAAVLAFPQLTMAQTPAKVENITISVIKNGVIIQDLDSLEVFYSGNRGGTAIPDLQVDRYDNQPFLYDSIKSMAINPKYSHYNSDKYIHRRNYDNNNNIISSYTENINGLGNSRITYSYDVNNRLVNTTRQNWISNAWKNHYKDSIVYNGQGLITATYRYSWGSTNTWQTNYFLTYSYVNGLLDEEKRYSWNTQTSTPVMVYQYKYFYNVSNRLDSIRSYDVNTNQFNGSTLYFYPTANEVITESYSYDNTAMILRKGVRKIMKYNNNGDLIESEHISRDYPTNTWNLGGTKQVYTYNNISGLKESETTVGFNNPNVYSNISRHLYVHNNGMYSYSTTELWNNNTSVWEPSNNSQISGDTIIVYHYQKFGTTSIPTTIEKAATIKLFPNPSSSFINIAIDWQEEQDFTIAIYSVQGQLVRQFGEQATKQYNKQIPIAGIANGNYILEVRGRDNRTTKQFTINQ